MPRTILLHLNGNIPDKDGRSAGDIALDLERAVRSGAGGDDSLTKFEVVLAEVVDGNAPEEGLQYYTVLGVYTDVEEVDGSMQRYASWFQADDLDHAEEQARDEAGDTLEIAGVVRGRIAVDV